MLFTVNDDYSYFGYEKKMKIYLLNSAAKRKNKIKIIQIAFKLVCNLNFKHDS